MNGSTGHNTCDGNDPLSKVMAMNGSVGRDTFGHGTFGHGTSGHGTPDNGTFGRKSRYAVMGKWGF
ncbi:hypothetical protein V8F06_005661 [Rhypophila decipiens]